MALKLNERDVLFVLFEQLGIESILEFDRYKEFAPEDLKMILSESAKFAREGLAPINEAADRPGVTFSEGNVTVPEEFHDAYAKYCEAGWAGAIASPDLGGQGLPMSINVACNEFSMAGCCGLILSTQLTTAAARVIENYASEELKNTYIPNMLTGKWAGTMCLTETSAGSDLAVLKTSAKKIPDKDAYLISGNKIFISFGDHDLTENIVHLVLARTEGAPAGSRGISLFVVPKYRVNPDGSLGDRNDVNCVTIEHKMGIHGSPTCTLNFGEDGQCEGFLLGKENRGIVYMFQMMNEERVNVGVQGLALGSACYFECLDYAAERLQGPMRDPEAPRIPIIEHADVRRMLLTMKAYSEGMRGLLLTTGYYEDRVLGASSQEEAEYYQNFVELFTPVCKAYCSDVGFMLCDLGVMVLGGYGYCSDYPVEQFLRDVKIAAVYEGTNGIQALDLLQRKLNMKGGALFKQYVELLGKFIAEQESHAALGEYVAKLAEAKDVLLDVTGFFGQKMAEKNYNVPVVNAVPYMELFGEIAVYHQLCQQAVIAQEKLDKLYGEAGADTDEAKRKLAEDNEEVKFYAGKITNMKFFANWVLPDMYAKSKALKTGDVSPIEVVF